jgi:hypothetical protein
MSKSYKKSFVRTFSKIDRSGFLKNQNFILISDLKENFRKSAHKKVNPEKVPSPEKI